MKTIAAMLLAATVGASAGGITFELVGGINDALAEQEQAGVCIAGYISQGIERSDITVAGSTCSVKLG